MELEVRTDTSVRSLKLDFAAGNFFINPSAPPTLVTSSFWMSQNGQNEASNSPLNTTTSNRADRPQLTR